MVNVMLKRQALPLDWKVLNLYFPFLLKQNVYAEQSFLYNLGPHSQHFTFFVTCEWVK